MLALLAASAAFTPSLPAASVRFTPSAAIPRALSPAPQMRLNARSAPLASILFSAAATLSPMAAHAEGAGVNGAVKAAAADALGPFADYAPYIGTFLFVAIYAAQTGALPGAPPKPPDTTEAPAAAPEAAAPEAAPEEKAE